MGIVALTGEGGLPPEVGLLVVVGGPQYRAGSHRMFTLLCRRMADSGVPAMRFDVRGMGDSTGMERRFDELDEDIAAAIDEFQRRVPSLTSVVLWGLCDGASASCLYDPADARVKEVILVNPWVRTPAGAARTTLRHYYGRRVFRADFWKKMLVGRLRWRDTFRSFLQAVRTAIGSADTSGPSLADSMADGLLRAQRRFWLILSEDDLVAQEFVDVALPTRAWTRAVDVLEVDRLNLPRANHTLATGGSLDEALEFSRQAVRWKC